MRIAAASLATLAACSGPLGEADGGLDASYDARPLRDTYYSPDVFGADVGRDAARDAPSIDAGTDAARCPSVCHANTDCGACPGSSRGNGCCDVATSHCYVLHASCPDDGVDAGPNDAWLPPVDAWCAGPRAETCDDVDEDCDGRVDEDAAGCVAVRCETSSGPRLCVGSPCCMGFGITDPCRACDVFELGSTVWCDGPEDCASGLGCCYVPSTGGDTLPSFWCTGECPGSWLCHENTDCPSAQPRCGSLTWPSYAACT